MFGKYLDNLRSAHPLIHCITNYVTANDVANVLLACGASPVMADDVEEAADMMSICDALYINIGTLNRPLINAMLAAGQRARELGRPVVLDPVGAGASPLRTEIAHELIERLRPDVIRANTSEMKALMSGATSTRGVDAALSDAATDHNLQEVIEALQDYSKRTSAIIAMTGAIDVICAPSEARIIRNGRPEMSLFTGAGCQLSGLVAAFLAANGKAALESTTAAVALMGVAGQIAWRRMAPGDGNSTYRGRLIDAVFNIDSRTLDEEVRCEIK